MIILHGENIVASRKKLTNELEKFSGEKIRFEGDKLTLTELKQALESQSLFGHDRLIIIDNFFSRRTSQEKEALFNYLKKEQPENLIFWEGKTIDGRKLVSFPMAKKEIFKLSSFIFKFLDSLSPKNLRNSLNFLHQSIDQESPEMVFYMLARQIRLLIMAKNLGKKGLVRMAPWQQAKLFRQAEKFELDQLLAIHRQLLEIDYQQKPGRSAISLNFTIDLLIASL